MKKVNIRVDHDMPGDIHREPIEWCDIWVSKGDGTDLPRVLLIGDSITRSYYPVVAEKLRGTYACARLATSKCAGDPLLLMELDLVLAEYVFDVIHFNNGLHGWAYPEATYASGLAEVLDVLADHVPKDRLIWANTTPMRSRENLAELDPITERVRERNRLAANLAAERGLPVNDLFAEVSAHPEYYRPDGVHFLEEGQATLGTRVAEKIMGLRLTM